MDMRMTLLDAESLFLEVLMEPIEARSAADIGTLLEYYLLPLLPAKTPVHELLAAGIGHLRKETVD
jgi:hypothetical protein